jgi:transposase InsO family protein
MRAVRSIAADPSGVELAAQLARARLLLGDSRAGFEWSERALAAATRLGLENVATDVLITRGTARFGLGEEEAGLADLRDAVARAQASGSLHTELRARNNLAWLVVVDDPRVTLETARQGFDLASAMGLGDIAVQLADVACAAAIDTGDWAWALATTAELEARGISDAYRIDLASTVAVITALQGDVRAVAVLDALEPLPEGTDSQVVAGLRHARAWCAFVAGDFGEAHRLADEAIAASFGAERVHQRALAARSSLWLADRAAAAADVAELEALNVAGRATSAMVTTLRAGIAALDSDPGARASYRQAAEAWRELDLPLQLALCLLDEHRLRAGQDTDAAEREGVLRTLGAAGLARLAGAAAEGGISPRPAPARPA